jgi:taurine dioxygenase
MSYLETPPIASVLYAREIPEVGANTSFADMYAALESMPAGLRQRLSDICVQHDSAYTSVGTLRDGATKVGDASEAVGAIHPAVRTHPETNRQALYMGRRLNASIQNMPMEQSEGLLDEIWSFCTQCQFVYEHVWQIGDLVMWDNRCTIHRRDAFDSEQRRIMWRTQVKAR